MKDQGHCPIWFTDIRQGEKKEKLILTPTYHNSSWQDKWSFKGLPFEQIFTGKSPRSCSWLWEWWVFQCRTKGDFQVAFSDKLPDSVYAPVLMLNFIHSSSVLYLPAVVNVSKFGSMLEGFWHLAYSHKPTFSLSHTHIFLLWHIQEVMKLISYFPWMTLSKSQQGHFPNKLRWVRHLTLTNIHKPQCCLWLKCCLICRRINSYIRGCVTETFKCTICNFWPSTGLFM